MGARSWLNLALLFIVALLVALLVYEPGKEQVPATTLTTLKKADIDRMVIARHGGEALHFERREGMWWLVEPIIVPANPVRLQAILQVAGAESLSHFPVEGRDLGDFGLVESPVRLTLNATELRFGGVSPLDQRRYVQVHERVHLIADGVFYDLVEPLSALVSRALLPPGVDIESVSVPAFAVSKTPAGEWRVQPPMETVSADTVQRWLQGWRDAHALQVAPYTATAGLGNVVVHLSGQDTPLTWRIVKREPEWVLARPELGLQYHFGRAQAEELLHLMPMSPPDAAARE